jgi:hypothetical protein
LVALRINEWKVLTALSQYIRLGTVSSLASVLAVGVKASATLGFLAEALLNALSVAKSVNIGGVSLALAVNAFSTVSLLTSLSARFSTTAVGRVAEFVFLCYLENRMASGWPDRFGEAPLIKFIVISPTKHVIACFPGTTTATQYQVPW